jgi:transcriptional regulator with XRE-family HTH domain
MVPISEPYGYREIIKMIQWSPDKLKKHMARKGVETQQLAHRIGVSLRTVQNWTAGFVPTAVNVMHIAIILDVMAEDLFDILKVVSQ